MDKKASWITQTAVLMALLIVMQAVTASFGNTIVTGSIVNLVLIASVIISGLSAGLTVAAISPVFAKFLGIGPLWVLIPFIIVGNMVFVLIWYLFGNCNFGKPIVSYLIAGITAAIGKFLILYTGIVIIAIPYLLNLPEKQATIISGMFSIPQLFTALVGGAIAIFMLPLLKKAVKSRL